ncbi:MAG: peptide chain release factor 2 [Firmicutes bacterium]|nr:peptide chain release factor 2 [Bacillota bacterium]
MIIDDIKQDLKEISQKATSITEAASLDKLKKRLAELEELRQDPDLYKDLARAQKINIEAKAVGDKVDNVEELNKKVKDCAELADMLSAEPDDGMLDMLKADVTELAVTADKMHIATLLKGEYDSNNAIVSIHAGAGGTEAQDWADMLYRMYKMYCDKVGYAVKELDYLAGDEAGIKGVTFLAESVNAYGYLKAEKGVHRLVRISPFDSGARRHTSFASVEVMPEIEGDTTINIAPDELRIDTYRSSGAGGQHVNKTDSAVRITHLPTNTVVSCQNGRSQIQNRETAMKMLISKLVERRERENLEKAQSIQGTLKKIEWGSQIRSYVFHPYSMVKDHRTGCETGNVYGVMDGDLEEFIIDYLKQS